MSGIVGKNLGRGSGVVKATPVADESVIRMPMLMQV